MSHYACHMSYAYYWSFGHAEQLLFSCLYSKVSICNYVTCHMSHVACHMSHVTCLMSNAYVVPWDMLNNFCFHVYAQKWIFVIMSHVTFRMSHVICKMLMLILNTCWTTFVFMWKLKSEYLWLCHMSHVTCRMSHVTCHMSYVKCLCW